MEKLFHLKENGTNVKTEVMAGITTFLAMAYILAVNPSMLGDAGMNSQGVFMATALAAAVATIVMALLANYPIALASGMGLNAYFAYTICLGELADQANPWQIALTAILVEGIIFIILSAFKFRETLVNCIPENLKYGITTGIGLFITFIGLQNAGIAAAGAPPNAAQLPRAAGRARAHRRDHHRPDAVLQCQGRHSLGHPHHLGAGHHCAVHGLVCGEPRGRRVFAAALRLVPAQLCGAGRHRVQIRLQLHAEQHR